LKKWNLLEQTAAPDGTVVSLYEHDGTYGIRVGSAGLMSTRRYASEEEIARLACAHLKTKRGARVLVGGLGLGFTLKAALACLRPDAVVAVAEILAAVIEWNRNPAYPLAGAAMADPRVTILHQDVVETIRASPGAFNAIIFDIDNGPVALTTEGNVRLYGDAGLRLVYGALRPGGRAAFWSATPDATFEKALARAGFATTTHRYRAHVRSGPWHIVFVADRLP
jgi:spermidine synthase